MPCCVAIPSDVRVITVHKRCASSSPPLANGRPDAAGGRQHTVRSKHPGHAIIYRASISWAAPPSKLMKITGHAKGRIDLRN